MIKQPLRKESMPYSEDKALVEAVKSGDKTAFRQIVLKYDKLIAGVVKGMIGNNGADDVGQETFIRFYRSVDQYKGEAGLGTYLVRIAVNLTLNEIKKRNRKRWYSLEDDLNINREAEDNYRRMEKSELINKAMAKLDPEFRSVVVLRLMQGYSTKETAEILQIPLGTVLSRLARGQEKLREILKKLGYIHNE